MFPPLTGGQCVVADAVLGPRLLALIVLWFMAVFQVI